MKKGIVIFLIFFCHLTSASNVNEEIRSILNLEEKNQLIFSVSQIQKGQITPSTFESCVKLKIKIELIHYNNVIETEDTFLKTDNSLKANNDLLGISEDMILFSHNQPLELVPVSGVIRISADELNSLLATTPNPYYADMKISLVRTGLLSGDEIANITFDMDYLRYYLDTGLRENHPLELNLKNEKTGVNAFLKIRLIKRK